MGDLGQRGSRALAFAGVVFVLVFVAVVARTQAFPIIHRYPSVNGDPGSGPPQRPPPSSNMRLTPQGDANPILEAILQVLMAIVVIGLAAAVGIVAIKVIQNVVRQQHPAVEDEVGDDEPAALRSAVTEHLTRVAAALDVEGDVNTVIVHCWEGLEQLAADGGTVREATQTAREFTRTVLESAELPRRAIDQLADLYEAALFSGEQLPERARGEAIRCLEDLLAAAGDRQ